VVDVKQPKAKILNEVQQSNSLDSLEKWLWAWKYICTYFRALEEPWKKVTNEKWLLFISANHNDWLIWWHLNCFSLYLYCLVFLVYGWRRGEIFYSYFLDVKSIDCVTQVEGVDGHALIREWYWRPYWTISFCLQF
jgi:hypothetical protein